MMRKLFRLPWRSAGTIADDVDAELHYHITARTEELESRGVTPQAALAQARREFGDLAEAGRALRRMDKGTEAARRRRDFMGDLRTDIAYSLRTLRAAPAFALTALITLALGIGATTAIFSVVHGVLIKPLPFPNPDRVVRVFPVSPQLGITQGAVSPVNLDDWRAQQRDFVDLGGYWYDEAVSGVDLTGDGEPKRLSTAFVEPGFFPAFGVNPVTGRLPREDEMHRGDPNQVVVLSYSAWQRVFSGSPSVVDHVVTLDGKPYHVLGVMPRDFRYPSPRVDAYVPYATITDEMIPRIRDVHVLDVVGRLKPGVTIEQGQGQLTAIMHRLGEQYPENKLWTASSVEPLRDVMVGPARTALVVLLGAVSCLLLLACANLANLLLARATVREREFAVRSALGARRGRLVRQLLTEAGVLACTGGALGVLMAFYGTRALVAMGGSELPRAADIGLDPSVLLFALGLSLATGLLFGLVPALRAASPGLHGTLRDAGRGNSGGRGQRARSMLVVGEVAIAVVLVVGAGLMTRSFTRLLGVDLGFNPGHVLVVNYVTSAQHQGSFDDMRNFYSAVLERVRTVPGVVGVGATSAIPFRGTGEHMNMLPQGYVPRAGEARPRGALIHVSDGYFKTLGVPVLDGREFVRGDDSSAAPVMIINQAFATRYFSGEYAVGRTITSAGTQYRIVGVVGNIRQESVEARAEPVAFVDYLQDVRIQTNLVIRTRGEPVAMAGAIHDAIWSVDHNQTIASTFTLSSAVGDAVARPRLLTDLLSLFGALGLAMGSIGLYGVLAYFVMQRRREIGVRVALGADRTHVLRMVVGRGLWLAGIGIVAGLLAAGVFTRFMQGVLFGVGTTDPATFAGVAAAVFGVAFLASWIPARRAARVDPLIAMRAE